MVHFKEIKSYSEDLVLIFFFFNFYSQVILERNLGHLFWYFINLFNHNIYRL